MTLIRASRAVPPAALLALAFLPATARAQRAPEPPSAAVERETVLPYPVHKQTLANGLDIIVIETPEFKNVLSFNTIVLAGSRDETEAGKTGLAHLFEHILFRHRYAGEDNGYDKAINHLGAHNNAWTSNDVTYYHPLTFVENLETRRTESGPLAGIMELEAQRFMNLDFTEKIFKTETGAVLGEYRRAVSFPDLKMSERLLGAMFPAHPYGHTALGTYEDVLDMPNEHAAALKFYRDYYRPDNCVLVIAGDVRAEEVIPKLSAVYSSWERKTAPAAVAEPNPRVRELRDHLDWDSDVAPLVWVAYGMPAFDPARKEAGVAQVLEELLVAPAAPLYKELRYEKQTVSSLGFEEGRSGFETAVPRLLVLGAQLYQDKYAQKGAGYFEEVGSDVVAGLDRLKTFSKGPQADALLDVVKSKYRYDFLASLSSPSSIASRFAWYYRFGRDPAVLDTLLALVRDLRPEDIDAFAERYFRPENRMILTMSYKPGAKEGP